MALIIRNTFTYIYDFHQQNKDESLVHLPFMGSQVPLMAITLLYLLFVLKLGPYLMRNRAPLAIKSLIQIYNICIICVNLYLTILGFRLLFVPDQHSFGCILSLPATHALKRTELTFGYIYFLVKISDYMDTVFFVLRKSFKQVTILHVYHHVMMAVTMNALIRNIGTGGHHLFTLSLNAFIHVIMYSYYFLSALRPKIQQSKWKRNITKMQMVQFILIALHNAWPLLFRSDCQYSKLWHYVQIIQSLIILILFSNFYLQSYLKKNKSEGEKIKLVQKIQ